jgi:hypothetical protein
MRLGIFAPLAVTMMSIPLAVGATDFEVEEWSVTWEDPDFDGIPNPIARFDDFEDGTFDGAPIPECFSLATRYCEISGEVRPGDESGGRLALRNPSFNAANNQVDQFLLLPEFHRGPMITTATFVLDVPAPGQSYSLQLVQELGDPADLEHLAVFVSRGAPGTPEVSNLFAGLLDVKRDVLVSLLDLGAADSIVAETFDLELSLIPSNSILRPEACVRLGAGSCTAVDASGAPDFPGSPFATAILGVSPTQRVDVDLKPGSDTNPIKVGSRGVIPFAILGSSFFDVAEVDVTTLAFGPDAAAPAHRNGPHVTDVNGDGVDDLLAHFSSDESGIALGDEEACVTGATLDGNPFEGCDTVRTVAPH